MLTQILDANILSLWNGKRELVYPYIIAQKSNTKAELVNKGLESEKKRWSKHENKRTQKNQMQNLNQWVGYLNERIKVNLCIDTRMSFLFSY